MFYNLFVLLVAIATIGLTIVQIEGKHDTEPVTTKVPGKTVFDTLLENIESEAKNHTHCISVPIPDIYKTMKYKLFWYEIEASLEATDGVVCNLDFPQRIGTVLNETTGPYTDYSTDITLGNQLVYKHYELKFGRYIQSGGSMSIDVGRNPFTATLKSHLHEPDCLLTLESLKLQFPETTSIIVELSEHEFFDFQRYIAQFFMEHVKDVIWNITETYTKDLVNCVIKDMKTCDTLARHNSTGATTKHSTQSVAHTTPALTTVQTVTTKPPAKHASSVSSTSKHILSTTFPHLFSTKGPHKVPTRQANVTIKHSDQTSQAHVTNIPQKHMMQLNLVLGGGEANPTDQSRVTNKKPQTTHQSHVTNKKSKTIHQPAVSTFSTQVQHVTPKTSTDGLEGIPKMIAAIPSFDMP